MSLSRDYDWMLQITRRIFSTDTITDTNYTIIVHRRIQFVPGGGDLAYERVGMLVVSLRGVNFGFWSHLGCSVENAIIFSREGLV